MSKPFQPISKRAAADILDVSTRTIEFWVASGYMPKPAGIGRQVYWHPDVFYGWLDSLLSAGPSAEEAGHDPGSVAGTDGSVSSSRPAAARSRARKKSASAEASRARDAERLSRLSRS